MEPCHSGVEPFVSVLFIRSLTGFANSDLVEAEVSIYKKEAVMPVKYKVVLWNLLTTLHNQLHHLIKVTFT